MILAIDPSASRTGWVKGLPGGPVQIGSLGLGSTPGELGPPLDKLDKWLDGALAGVTMVFYEEPVNSKFQRLDGKRLLYSLGAQIELVCFRRQIRVRECAIGKCKKTFYGKGNFTAAEKAERGVEIARTWGFEPSNHDEADACSVFITGLKDWFPDDFKRWVERRARNLSGQGKTLL